VKLVTSEIRGSYPPKRFLGALLSESSIVDLGAAQAASGKGPDSLPGDMLAFLEAGDAALASARSALEYARANPGAKAPDGRTLVWPRGELRLLPLIGGWFRIGPQYLMLAMLYCTLLPTMAAATPTGVLRLLDRFDLLSWQAAVTPGVRLILAGAAWLASARFEVFLLIWYITDLVGDLALWALAFRELRKRDLLRGLRPGLGRHARHLAGAWRFALMTNLTTSLSAAWGPMANLLVGALLGPIGAGQYRIAATVVEAANKPADMLSKAFYPEVVRMDFATKRPWKLMLRGAVLSGSMGLLIVLIVLVGGKPFIAAAFGKAFAPAGGLLALMVFGMLLTMIGFPLGPMSYAIDRPDGPLRARMVSTLVYLILIFPFTRLWQLTGAGLAFVVSMLIMNVLMLPPLITAYRRRAPPQPTHAA